MSLKIMLATLVHGFLTGLLVVLFVPLWLLMQCLGSLERIVSWAELWACFDGDKAAQARANWKQS